MLNKSSSLRLEQMVAFSTNTKYATAKYITRYCRFSYIMQRQRQALCVQSVLIGLTECIRSV
ncbi:MAG: hypothetical protein M3269_01050 [Thermoproteota archaeon]|nr:hypothetical protein [Thermoproteota archaeon]